MNIRSMKIKRISIALLLMFALSFGSVFAADEIPANDAGIGTQAETPASDAGDGAQIETPVLVLADNSEKATAKTTGVVKKGKYYYYYYPKTGKKRTKKGFVTYKNKLYYISGRKGRIVTNKTFKVKKKYYHARKNGKIATGVYKWNKKLNYSEPETGEWIKKECIVTWKGDKYYVRKGGTIAVKDVFTYKNKPYQAGDDGKLLIIPIPDNGNAVLKVAKEQVGIMTGKKYWKWYFHTKFRDTDRTPWCGAFVAWCFNEAGEYDRVAPVKKHGNLGYVPSYTSYANKHGKWVKKSKARGGDIVIYYGSVHVGLVEGIWNGYLITIEGNAGPTSYIRGAPGAVVRRIHPIDSWKQKGVIRVF